MQYNINDIQSMTPEELAAVKKQAYRNIAGFIALKIGITVGIALTARHLRKKLEEM